MTTTAIGYIRRSTDKQDESLTQQRTKLEAFARARGWTLDAVYEDDAISGSDMKRPGLDRLMDRVLQDDGVGVVLAWDRNRLARPKDAVDGMLLERRLLDAGKRVVYAASGQEADRSFTSGLLSYVEHHQNGDYLRKLSRDTIRGVAARVEQGYWPGGPIPFGYDRLILDSDGKPRRIVRDLDDGSQAILDPTTGQQVEHLPKGRRYGKQDHELCTLIPSTPARVRAVQRMFADFAAGIPSRQLRQWLNESGFRTSRGSIFTIATILPILENPAYLGQCVYNRRTLSKWHRFTSGQSQERYDEGVEKRPAEDWIVKENAWPALVDQSAWDQVQARRDESKREHRHITGRAIKGNYLLTSFAYCGVCGSRLTGQTTTSGKGYRTRYYVCSGHHSGHRDKCPKRFTVPADVVEQYVLDIIEQDLAQLRDDQPLHDYIKTEVARLLGGRQDARQQLRRTLADLDQQMARLRDHVMAMPPEAAKGLGLYEQAADLAQQRQDIEKQLAALPDDLPGLPSPDVIMQRAKATFDRLKLVVSGGTLEEKRQLVGAFVKRIEADPDRQAVQISLFPALFSSLIAGAGFEPATSGL